MCRQFARRRIAPMARPEAREMEAERPHKTSLASVGTSGFSDSRALGHAGPLRARAEDPGTRLLQQHPGRRRGPGCLAACRNARRVTDGGFADNLVPPCRKTDSQISNYPK